MMISPVASHSFPERPLTRPDAVELPAGEQPTEAADQQPRRVGAAAGGEELSEGEQREVDQLEKRDAEVKAHEAAHIAAGGQYVNGGAT